MLSKFTSTEEALAYALGRAGRTLPMAKTVAREGMFKAHIMDNGNVIVEGFISTPARDIEKDVLEPEAFFPGLRGYMQRGAPISVEHNTKTLPVGYMTQSKLVRDGALLEAVENPKNPPTMDYLYYDGGTGWYGQGIIYDDAAKKGVINGTVGSFSWIGMPKDWEDIPGGGRRFHRKGAIDPLIETTITAYPINQTATMRIAKAAGFMPAISMQDIYELVLNDPKFAEVLVQMIAPGISKGAKDKTAWIVSRFSTADIPVPKSYRDYFTKE